jgi:hypothetical protein
MKEARREEVDGVDLSWLQVGLTYNVTPMLGAYLVTSGAAEWTDSEPDVLIRVSEQRISVALDKVQAVAADRSRSSRRRK